MLRNLKKKDDNEFRDFFFSSIFVPDFSHYFLAWVITIIYFSKMLKNVTTKRLQVRD